MKYRDIFHLCLFFSISEKCGGNLPRSSDLGGNHQCNGLVGIWQSKFNSDFTRFYNWPIAIYVTHLSSGIDEDQRKMAVLRSGGYSGDDFFFGIHQQQNYVVSQRNESFLPRKKSSKRRYRRNTRLESRVIEFRFKNKYSVEERYVNEKGNWCISWNVGDAGYIYNEYDAESKAVPIGLVVKISDQEAAKLLNSPAEEHLKAWSIKVNQYLASDSEAPNIGIGKRSKGCYFSVAVDNFTSFFNVAVYGVLTNSTWGIDDRNIDFTSSTFNSKKSIFSKLARMRESKMFIKSDEHYRFTSQYGEIFELEGPNINPGISIHMEVNPCDPQFKETVSIFCETNGWNRRKHVVGRATPLTDSAARSL